MSSAVKLRVLATLLAVVVLSASGAVAPAAAQAVNTAGAYEQHSSVEVDSCQTIDGPGTYTLTAAIANESTDACIEITASDVEFDGNGYTVYGVNNSVGDGVTVDGSSVSNVTVRSLAVTTFSHGVHVANASGVMRSQSSTRRWLRRFRYHYNHERPNQALNGRTPAEEVLN